MATLLPCPQTTTKTRERLGGSTSEGTETHFCGVSPKQNPGGACAWTNTCASSYKVLPAEGDTLDEGDGKHDILGGCTQGSWGHRLRPSVHQNNVSFRWTRSALLPRAGPSQAGTVSHAAKALTELPGRTWAAFQTPASGTAYPKVQTVGATVCHGPGHASPQSAGP